MDLQLLLHLPPLHLIIQLRLVNNLASIPLLAVFPRSGFTAPGPAVVLNPAPRHHLVAAGLAALAEEVAAEVQALHDFYVGAGVVCGGLRHSTTHHHLVLHIPLIINNGRNGLKGRLVVRSVVLVADASG